MADPHLSEPFVVLERETQRLDVIQTIDDLRAFVEEFQDILEDDFVVWDAKGQRLRFGHSFIAKHPDVASVTRENDTHGLKRVIGVYLGLNPEPRLAVMLDRLRQGLKP